MPQSETEEIQSSYGDPKGKTKTSEIIRSNLLNRFRDAVGEQHCFVFVLLMIQQKQNGALLRLRRGCDFS